MFSPYYAFARRQGAADPQNHCALNVALYGRPSGWAMTERGRGALACSAHRLAIGPSALEWDGDRLTVSIDEVTAPLPSRLRGVVRVRPAALCGYVARLDPDGLHHWSPFAACSTVEIDLASPSLRWRGRGYMDTNWGAVPLEHSFARWHWSRAALGEGAAITYDVTARAGAGASVAIRTDAAGRVQELEPPPPLRLPRTRWGIDRETRAAEGTSVTVQQTLEDAPFYARSLLSTAVGGEPALAMHESLDLDRFAAPWVQAMLPFRMPRRWW